MGLNLNFNEKEIVLTLSVMSDMHTSGSWGVESSENKLRKAFHYAKKAAGRDIDAYLFNGDFCDCLNSRPNVVYGIEGWPDTYEEALALQSRAEFDIWHRIFGEEIDKKSEIIYCLGNHDSNNANNNARFVEEFSSRDSVGDNKNFNRMYRTDIIKDGMYTGRRHCVFKDYHFICLDRYDDMTDSCKFLRREMEFAVKDNPDRYVFVLWHCKTPKCEFCGDSWGSCPEIDTVLKDYPQSVLITGHTHCALANERSILQHEFTVIEASSVSCVAEDTLSAPGSNPLNFTHEESYKFSQGLIIELDKTGNMRIRRLDYYREKEIKYPWILKRPCGNKVQLSDYTAARRFEFTPPLFDDDFQIQVSSSGENGTFLCFTAAKHGDMVFRYEVKVTDLNGKSRLFYLSSRFCMHPDTADMPRQLSAVLPIKKDDIYLLSVTPQDVWYNSGHSKFLYF